MANEINSQSSGPAVFAYARLLRELHAFIAAGKGDSGEAEDVADLMDAPWRAMTQAEQTRMRGLSRDLYALREGGPKRLEMTEAQIMDWHQRASDAYGHLQAGEIDAALEFSRQPVPSRLSQEFFPFFQSLCWEKLGDLETALFFMKEVERLNPKNSLQVLYLLHKLERAGEVSDYVERFIKNSSSTPLELYVASHALEFPTRHMSPSQAMPILHKAADVLKRALDACSRLAPKEKEEFPDAEFTIALALGADLELLGDRRSAVTVYSNAISKTPYHGELYLARGLALYETELSSALSDFDKAARLRVSDILPYLLLARRALQGRFFAEALRLALVAERMPGPASARAEAYETIAIAYFEMGQNGDMVLENFDKALALDPKNNRICKNREIAATRGGQIRRHPTWQIPPTKAEGMRQFRSDQFDRGRDWIAEQQLRNRANLVSAAGSNLMMA